MFTDCCVLVPRTNGTTASQYGLSLGNANAGSNWLAFMARMGINYGRLFVNTNTDLRSSLGSNFGALSADGGTCRLGGQMLYLFLTIWSARQHVLSISSCHRSTTTTYNGDWPASSGLGNTCRGGDSPHALHLQAGPWTAPP